MTFAEDNAGRLMFRQERKEELEGILGREISDYEFRKIQGEVI